MFMSKILVGVCLGATLLFIQGCGGSGSCRVVGLNVAPATATVDHTAATPGNSQVFNAIPKEGGDCQSVGALAAPSVNWTVSDPSVHLSSSQGILVTATCTAALANSVTITATPTDGETFTGKASL